MRRPKSPLFSRDLHWTDALLVMVCVALGFACANLQVPLSQIFSNTTEISYAYIGRTSDGVRYVIDDGHARLLAFDESGQELFEIVDPSDDGESVLYIDDVFADGDVVYLCASEWSGMLLSRELILSYDTRGDYLDTIHEITYDLDRNATNKHRIYGLHREGDTLVWAECDANAVRVLYQGLDGQTSPTLWTYSYKNAFNAVSDIVFEGGDPIILNKDGRIERYIRNADPQLIYTTTWKGEEERVPFRMAIAGGEVYFTDIRAGSVQKVVAGRHGSQTVQEATDSQTVTFSENGEEMILAESEGLLAKSGESETRYDSLRMARSLVSQHMTFFSCLVLFAIAALLALLRLISIFWGRFFESINVGPIIVVSVAFVVCSVVSYLLIDSFRGLYLGKISEQLQMTASQVASRITSEDLDGVNLAQDYDTESYEHLVQVMDQAMPLDVEFFHTTYCNILRLDDGGESGYAIAYRDQSVGTFFPLDEVETSEVREVYESGKAVWNEAVQDVSGTYVSIKSPIWGGVNNVVGVVAVGADTSVVSEIIMDMQKKVLLSIVLVLLLFWIIATEAISLTALRAARKKRDDSDEDVPIYLVRVLVFSVFAAFNLVSSFLPVYVLHHSEAVEGPLRDIAPSLPLTINIFAMGIMSLFCATAMRRFGTRRVFVGSMACSIAGNAMLFLAPGYPLVVFGLLLDGIGVGMITNAIYVALTYLPDESERQGAFATYNGASISGINFGMILGSVLAVSVGQRAVFIVVAVTWAALMIMGIYLGVRIDRLMSPADEEEEVRKSGKISPARFLRARPIWSFILLVQNPYIVFNSFAFYFVPLFCEGAGLAETIASVLLMVYSQTAVMLGDALTLRMEKSFGGRSVYVALGLNIVAVALYVSTQTLWSLVGALIILGVSAAFAKPCQQALYLRQDASRQLGEDQAMGIYNFSENIGESLGPIVFGGLMAGPVGYVWAFLGAVACAGATHFTLNRKGMRRGE